MKLISKLAITSAVLALAFISTANAQSMNVDVPFGFHAGKLSLPAGTYKVEVNQRAQRVTLNQLDGKYNCFLMVKDFDSAGPAEHGSLVFNQYGSSYFLTRVKTAGIKGDAEMFTSPAEREFAKTQPEAKEIALVASGR
jgi:hypothetical protein